MTRTAISTGAAIALAAIIAGGWHPDDSSGSGLLLAAFLLPLILGALPVVNIILAVRDARALERGGLSLRGLFLWSVMLLCVVINFMLLAVAFLIGAMLINGPIVA